MKNEEYLRKERLLEKRCKILLVAFIISTFIGMIINSSASYLFYAIAVVAFVTIIGLQLNRAFEVLNAQMDEMEENEMKSKSKEGG